MSELTKDDIDIVKATISSCSEQIDHGVRRIYGAEVDDISADEVNCASAVMVNKLDDIINTSDDDVLVGVAKELREQIGSTPTGAGLDIVKAGILITRHSVQSLSMEDSTDKLCQEIHTTFNKVRAELAEEEAIAKEFN